MPFIRSLVSERCMLLISSIALNGEIINPCSCCAKKGLVYITITEPSSRQPSSYSKCIKSNTRILYNMHSVSLNKCTFLACLNSY